MSCIHSTAANAANQTALLLTLANLEQAAKHAAKALLSLDDSPPDGLSLDALIDGIQRKADALRMIRGSSFNA